MNIFIGPVKLYMLENEDKCIVNVLEMKLVTQVRRKFSGLVGTSASENVYGTTINCFTYRVKSPFLVSLPSHGLEKLS